MDQGRVNQERRMALFKDAYDLWLSKRLTQHDAAGLLGVDVRTFRRWMERYDDGGVDALVDKRLGRGAHNEAPVNEVMELVANYRERHEGWNVRHYYDHYRDAGGTRSYSWVKNKLQEKGAVPRRAPKGKHRMRREPAAAPGMVLHQDASTHDWFNNGTMPDLVVTMDDATNEIYSIFLCDEEGTESSLRGVLETIGRKGVFCELRTDRGSHYWHTAKAGGKVDKSKPTQFKKAMDRLGIHLEPAYSPEARGRSERVFGTLQGRLPQEFAQAGIDDIETANEWLVRDYLPRHNRRFAHPARLAEQSYFSPYVDPSALDGILCETHERVVGGDNCVNFEGMILQIPAQPHRPTYRKARVKVKRHINGDLSIWHGPRRLAGYAPNGELEKTESLDGQEPRKATGRS